MNSIDTNWKVVVTLTEIREKDIENFSLGCGYTDISVYLKYYNKQLFWNLKEIAFLSKDTVTLTST